jgi:hypothetical protein
LGNELPERDGSLSSDNKYFAVYNNVDGLVPSCDVVLNGVKVGQVQKN